MVQADLVPLRENAFQVERWPHYFLSHDLRSPLGAILNYATAFDDDRIGPRHGGEVRSPAGRPRVGGQRWRMWGRLRFHPAHLRA